MSFEEEWASVRTASTASVSMRLNQVAPEPGGGGGNADLSVDQDKLGAIGSAAYALHGRLAKDGNHARTNTTEAAGGMSSHGFRTGSAMATVQETWSSQLNTLLDACANISNHLDYSAASHAKEEADIKAALAASKINEYFK
ncbi:MULTISPECIES: hypothetical protein [unclassified Streptomyces]|uniref:hypothetical protein n=1 Tax=unclassified Streptomyces TaxID=2593676 RepID=UPI001660826B|nr:MULTISPECIES: hypothetical protein [unclassified Streptomyces]MBD0708134.1 hypothetical protein [Streptomyces sp. CBMA291]MBD0715781.1 hypothetical protein [Streptomyces sp. CBMA370]